MAEPGPAAPDVSVVLVTYNSADWIQRCIASLGAALDGLNAELVVLDNGSQDGSAELTQQVLGSAFPAHQHIMLRNEVNAGFSAAVNRAVAASGGHWILLLNPDTVSRPGALRQLLDFARMHPGHGLYGGRTLNPDGSVQPSSCWALPSLWSITCFALGLSTLWPKSPIFDPESMGRWQRDTVREVGMVTGCLLLVPRSVWQELHGLDERYFVYGEDADFAARARKAGYRPIITPAAEVMHEVGASSSSTGKLVLLLAGKITYSRTHLGWRAPIAVALLRLGVAARALTSRASHKGGKWSSAWTERARWWDGFSAQLVAGEVHT